MVVILSAGVAQAAMTPGKGALFVNAGYATGKSAITGDNLDGGFVSLEFEKMDWANPVTGGFTIGYGQIRESVGADSTDYTISSVPVLFGGKYWLGGGPLQGFIGISFGMYFSRLETTHTSPVSGASTDYSSETTLGFGLAFPLGLSLSIGDTLMLNAGYVINWLWS
ncbi:MAG: hypothetical protein R3284_11490, partial [Rubricoccaceae bacterium]|nr:hypothetical protein [Rubricoccaceae bacterium]